jgi:hypothetical protein
MGNMMVIAVVTRCMWCSAVVQVSCSCMCSSLRCAATAAGLAAAAFNASCSG